MASRREKYGQPSSQAYPAKQIAYKYTHWIIYCVTQCSHISSQTYSFFGLYHLIITISVTNCYSIIMTLVCVSNPEDHVKY